MLNELEDNQPDYCEICGCDIDPENDDHCPNCCYICGQCVGSGSHYHCPNCGETCGMMGHLNEELQYSCKKKENHVSDFYNEDEK